MELLSKNTGNWEIYRMIDDVGNAFIIRFPKSGFARQIDSYINNHKIIQNVDLPTLSLVERFQAEHRIGVRTEDINYEQEKIYVSYNSLYSDSRKVLDQLSRHFIKIDLQIQMSQYEEFRYRNKLTQITNFKEFLMKINTDLMTASLEGILIEFDSYFLGTTTLSDVSTIDYKIVDLDNIYINKRKKTKELYDSNISEFTRAITGFLKYFVCERNQIEYLELLKSQQCSSN